ncbi:hypothetical protein CEXT_29781 [Caerostris extrusa]|uniref:Uncharacterized protein n=1 Tax=Caerostris extrusa TaxID=172846 RepID=A0AAV4U5R5_CAEEX|nr:hypothetical protein CEXT_29781 [Caerostris extrusa]
MKRDNALANWKTRLISLFFKMQTLGEWESLKTRLQKSSCLGELPSGTFVGQELNDSRVQQKTVCVGFPGRDENKGMRKIVLLVCYALRVDVKRGF